MIKIYAKKYPGSGSWPEDYQDWFINENLIVHCDPLNYEIEMTNGDRFRVLALHWDKLMGYISTEIRYEDSKVKP